MDAVSVFGSANLAKAARYRLAITVHSLATPVYSTVVPLGALGCHVNMVKFPPWARLDGNANASDVNV